MRFQLKCVGSFLGGVLLMACANLASASCEEYFIISNGDTILVGEDIASYSRTSHRLVLTDDGFAKWTSYENQAPPEGSMLVERTLLTDREFTIINAGEVVAEGHFISGTESHLQSGLVLWDALAQQAQSRLKFGYFRLEADMPPDPLESMAFLDYFDNCGKLID